MNSWSWGIAHGQLPGEHEARGGRGDDPRFAPKLGRAVALAFTDRGNGGIVDIDDFTAGQGLAVGETPRLGDELLMGGQGAGQGRVPALALLRGQRGGAWICAWAVGASVTTGLPSSAAAVPSGAPDSQRLSPARDTAAQSGA